MRIDPWDGEWDEAWDADEGESHREWSPAMRIIAWVAVVAMLLTALSGVVTLVLR